MKIGLFGTGNLATSLGTAWAAAGHTILVSGRNAERAGATAERIGAAAEPVDPIDLGARADVLVVAVAWTGLQPALTLAGGPTGTLSGRTVAPANRLAVRR